MNRFRFFATVSVFFLVISFAAAPLKSQTSGKVTGLVRDGQTGEALPGANVLIEGTSLGAAADFQGRYTILRVPPGQHTLRVDYIGYQAVTVKSVEVLTDLTTRIDVELQPIALQGEEVVIVAEKPLVRKDLTSSESRIQADEIQNMPVQEVGDILDLQAGITRDMEGDLHIRGGRSSEIAYMVNGISITDDYSRSEALTVENESVQELQVISGTFNAEYGNAMSGVVNIVTRDGSNDFSAKFEAWTGDYLSNHKNIFWHIDDIDPLANTNLQGMISGPILKDRLTYFITGRISDNDGWLYGPEAYLPAGLKVDSSAVAMNPQKRRSLQGSMKWKISNPLSLKVDFLGSQYENNNYNHIYRLNPGGRRNYYGQGGTVIAKLTHVLGKRSFYETTFSVKKNQDKSYLFKNPYDAGYVHPDSLTAGSYSFYKAGTDPDRSDRSTRSLIGKIDFTSQVNDKHQVKAGLEMQRDKIDFEEITLIPATDANGNQITPYVPKIDAVSSTNHDLFTREPDKYAVYLQDKIEYESVVINIGVRYDYFNSHGLIPIDSEDPNIYNPLKLKNIYKDLDGDGSISIAEQVESNAYTLAEKKAFWYRKADTKTQVSPRLGIAYPITDNGVIHFSYGIFQQVPEYSQLYQGDEIKLTKGQGIAGPYGNPDLDPQRTTMYELGLKQQLSENISIDVTGYYRDIRDWISTSPSIPSYTAGVSYSTYINRDFANVKGVTLMLTRRMADHVALNLDYTYQVAQGTNSSPEDEYNALTNGDEPKKQLAPLSWDQRHALNLTVFYGHENWGVNSIAQFYSGQPYTPEVVSGTTTGQNVISGLSTNTRRLPNRFTIDVNAYRKFTWRRFEMELFVKVYNLLDGKNPTWVFEETGKPDYSVYENQSVEADPTWFVRPDFYSEPRRIQLGFKVSI